MQNIITFLEGKKTYLIAIVLGITSSAKFLGYIDEETFQIMFALLTGGGLAALHAKKPEENTPVTKDS